MINKNKCICKRNRNLPHWDCHWERIVCSKHVYNTLVLKYFTGNMHFWFLIFGYSAKKFIVISRSNFEILLLIHKELGNLFQSSSITTREQPNLISKSSGWIFGKWYFISCKNSMCSGQKFRKMNEEMWFRIVVMISIDVCKMKFNDKRCRGKLLKVSIQSIWMNELICVKSMDWCV